MPELAKELKQWVTMAQPLPLATPLTALGLQLSWRSPQHFDDLNGNNEKAAAASLGCSLKFQASDVYIHQLFAGSAAQQAGLMTGDQILALAGYKVSEASLPQLLRRLPMGSVQDLVIFRKDRLLTLRLTMMPAPASVAMLTVADQHKVSAWLNP